MKEDEDIVTPPLDFNLGDYVTGKDRSYERSIYKVDCCKVDVIRGEYVTHFAFEFITHSEVKEWRGGGVHYFLIERAREYRTATRQELIESEVITQSMDFITEED